MSNNAAKDESAKDAILDRIRKANHGVSALEDASAAWAQIPRSYDAAPRPAPDALALLIERLRDYDAEVETMTEAEIPGRVRAILAARGIDRLLLPGGMRPGLIADLGVGLAAGLVRALPEAQFDHDLSPQQLDSFACVLTEATLGIAETGTLVLQNVPGQGRRAASLVPDVHICILRAADVAATVPEAMRRLQSTATLPTTFISGPSATADIEMTRIKGVHGPRFLHVLITE